MTKRVLLFAAATVCGLFFLMAASSPVMAQGMKRSRPSPYNRPVPCLLPTGKCIMQTGQQCDQGGGKVLEGCDTCDDCEKQGKVK